MAERGKMIERTCNWRNCREKFMAREADVKRGWAKFCSKSCKAKAQESCTGQNAAFHNRRDEYGEPTFDNAHQFSNEEHDCNKSAD